MHRDRLEVLRDLLRENAANPDGAEFDMGMWIGQSEVKAQSGVELAISYDARVLGVDTTDTHNRKHIVERDKLPTMSCGTVVCALGIAVISGRFEKWGLKAEYLVESPTKVILQPRCSDEDGFEVEDGYAAGATLFGISEGDSQYLFDRDCYANCPRGVAGELFVADRIDAFIRGEIEYEYHPDRPNHDED